MDHDLSNLNICIFDYLVTQQKGTWVNIKKIFLDITGPSGHRCSALKETHYNYFEAICYDLPSQYKNVNYNGSNGYKYLQYTDKPQESNKTKFYTLSDSNKFVKYSSHYASNKEEALIKAGDIDGITKMINKNKLDIIVDYERLINYAIKHEQYFMITDLVKLVVDCKDTNHLMKMYTVVDECEHKKNISNNNFFMMFMMYLCLCFIIFYYFTL
jgi:hypothetical protein